MKFLEEQNLLTQEHLEDLVKLLEEEEQGNLDLEEILGDNNLIIIFWDSPSLFDMELSHQYNVSILLEYQELTIGQHDNNISSLQVVYNSSQLPSRMI